MALNANNQSNLQSQDELLFEELSEQEQQAVVGGFNFSLNLNDLLDDLNEVVDGLPDITFDLNQLDSSVTVNGQNYGIDLAGSISLTGGIFTATGVGIDLIES